jgi:predicted nucleotidyltransferase component of viral defense system
MIPKIFIEKWRQNAPWQTLEMVEQDLIINRALVCLYNNLEISSSLIFRGGTALHKLYLKPSARYSEDLDFVQKKSEPIGKIIDAVRSSLGWLGEPSRLLTERSAKLIYKYISVNNLLMKLKIEINTTEHFQVKNVTKMQFAFDSEWFSGECQVKVNQLEELMATKIRALYQRRKGRDLFDLWMVFSKGFADVDEALKIFKKYCGHEGIKISKNLFLQNLELKRLNKDFQSDMNILLPHRIQWNFDEAFEYVKNKIINKIS